jgi:hypothetical protein
MARNKPLTKEEKRLQTLAIETEKQKMLIVLQLRKTPIVQAACERTGIGRSTYYKWRANDITFARAADRAIEAGNFLINDLAESKIIRMIQDNNLTAAIFWLKNNHPKYSINRIIHEYEVVTDRPSVEEQNVSVQEISRLLAKKIMPKPTVDETRMRIEKELDKNEKNNEFNDKLDSFEENPEGK